MKEETKVLHDLLKEVREGQKEQTEKLSKQGETLAKQGMCLNNLQEDFKEMKQHIAENKKDLREHMRRTNVLEQLHLDNQRRIEGLEDSSKKKEERIKKLEKPAIAKAWLKDNFKWLLTIGGLGASLVAKVMGLW